VFDLSHFEARWKILFASGDPYFSPRLARQSDDYRPDDEPLQTVFAGHPIFRHDEIKRILVVKVTYRRLHHRNPGDPPAEADIFGGLDSCVGEPRGARLCQDTGLRR
jgi:hypothetical protein